MKEPVQVVSAKAYYSNIGVFLRANGYNNFKGLRFDGVPFADLPKYGPASDVIRLESDKVTVERFFGATKRLSHWSLKQPELQSDLIPLTLSADAIRGYDDDDDDEVSGTHKHLAGLYEATYTDVPERWVPVDLEIVSMGSWNIDNFRTDFPKVVRAEEKGFSAATAQQVDLSSIVVYDDFMQLVMPDFLMYNAPCMLPATSFFSIIRHHLMAALDTRYAVLSSNNKEYLTVERVVKTRPYSTSREQYTARGNSYRPPRFAKQNTDVKRETVYSISCGTRYDGHTKLDPLYANNLDEMKSMIDKYLKELTDELNRPIQHCPHCEGTGLHEYKVKPIPFPVKS